jgi:hypothetical protein
MTAVRMWAIVLAALAAGAGVIAVVLTSDHQDLKVVWAIFGPAVGWSFIGTGLYAWSRRPESRTGALMVLMGFAWFFSTLESSSSPLLYTLGSAFGGLWGGVFLHLGMSFPSGRLASRFDRALVVAGYPIFTFTFAPALFFAGPEELDCEDCPENLLLVRRDEDLANLAAGIGAQEELQTSLAELRELAHGIHPAVLTNHGLEPALQALASRAPVPVTVEVDSEERLPDPVESAAYFVVSEALANVAKHARATEAAVAVRQENGRLTVEVRDDGLGGADAAHGSGLRGLADRLAALDGKLSLVSPAGQGTRLQAEIPCAPPTT